ncbi:hypothetical protein [Flavobacterium sp. HNIBRBA15423]|uniref:hypothetical protein n=1 Tax=Flavobacterium sp. HNIBRBA15423 TaxID=3458683 RepID=UPI0040442E91
MRESIFFLITLVMLGYKTKALNSFDAKEPISNIQIDFKCSDFDNAREYLISFDRQELCNIFSEDLSVNYNIMLVYKGNFKDEVFNKYSGYYYLMDSNNNKIGDLENIEIGNFGFVETKNFDRIQKNKKVRLSQLNIKLSSDGINDLDNKESTILMKIEL